MATIPMKVTRKDNGNLTIQTWPGSEDASMLVAGDGWAWSPTFKRYGRVICGAFPIDGTLDERSAWVRFVAREYTNRMNQELEAQAARYSRRAWPPLPSLRG